MAKAKESKTIEVRILVDTVVDGITHPSNTVATLDVAVAKELVAQGAADATPAAVAAAKEH